MNKTIGIISTLDTKGIDAEYIKNKIEEQGCSTIILDTGSSGKSQVKADISQEEIARKGGENFRELTKKSRTEATRVMINGAKNVVNQLFSEGKLDGVIALGGSTGTSVGISVMKILPIGFPKLMVSTEFENPKFIGKGDITIMQTPVDILGINRILERTLTLAAAAIVGMVNAENVYHSDKPLIGITALGVTTPAVINTIKLLEKKGYEILVFHLYTEILDRFIDQGIIDGIIDLTPAELVEAYILEDLTARKDRIEKALEKGIARKDRIEKALEKGIPQVIVPGGLDMIILDSPLKETQANYNYKGRILIEHNPYVTLARTTEDENIRLAKIISEKVNRATGPVTIVIPLKGFSAVDKVEQNFYDPVITKSFTKTIENNIRKEINLIKIDAHINDKEFAQKLVEIYENNKKGGTDYEKDI